MDHHTTGWLMDPSSFASAEFQALMTELRLAGVPEETIRRVAERHIQELTRKADKVQADVFNIGEQMRDQIDRLGTKLDLDLRAQHGSTNQMLADLKVGQTALTEELRGSIGTLQTAVVSMEASFRQIGEQVSGIEQDVGDLKQSMRESQEDRASLHAELAALTQRFDEYTNQSRRGELDDLRRQIDDVLQRLSRLEEARGDAG